MSPKSSQAAYGLTSVPATSEPNESAPADTREAQDRRTRRYATMEAVSINSATPADRSLLGPYRSRLREIWEYRQLLAQLTRRDIRIRYKQAVMGFGWAIFMPIVIVLAGVVVRYAMARLSGNSLDLSGISGMAVKALAWSYFVGALQFSVGSLVANMVLVSKVYFPREVLPLSATLAHSFDTMIGAVVLAIALPLLGVAMSPSLAWVILLVPLMFLLTASLGLFLSCANLFFRDVKYIVQVLITFGIFFTPVFFEPAMFGELGGRLMMANPLSPILEGFRLSVVAGHNLANPLMEASHDGAFLAWHIGYLAYSAAWAVGGALLSLRMFHRFEHKFAEYV